MLDSEAEIAYNTMSYFGILYMVKKLTIKNKNKSFLAEAILETEINAQLRFPQAIRKHLALMLNNKKVFLGGGALVIATFIANVLNYIFNAYLGRVLTFNDFSLIGLIGGFYSFASIFMGAYSTTVNYRGSFLIGKHGDSAGYTFWQYAMKRVFLPSIILTALWLISIPFLMNFFHTTNIYLFIFFSLILLVGFISNVNQGFLYAKMMFGALAITSLIDPIIRLATAFPLVSNNLRIWTFSAIPLAVFIVFISTWMLIKKTVAKSSIATKVKEINIFPKKFFFISLLSGISSVAYFTFDIFLAKHFLTPTQAGEYALISLVGKMIFFIGNLTSPFIIPIISRQEGANKNSQNTLYLLLGLTALLVFAGFILLGVFAQITVPILYGEKARVIVPYLLFFTFGMACYTLSNVVVNYYLARKNYLFTIASSFLILLQVGLILLFHTNVQAIAIVMSIVLMINLLVIMCLHLGIKYVEKAEKYMTHLFYTYKGRYGYLNYVFGKTK